jgi:hypothetical protein
MEINVAKTNKTRISERPSPLPITARECGIFRTLGSMINAARCVREINFRIAMVKVALNRKKFLGVKFKEKN